MDVIDYNTFEPNRKIDFIFKLFSTFNELTIKKNKFEYVYYAASIYRKACDQKKVCMTKLLRGEKIISESKEHETKIQPEDKETKRKISAEERQDKIQEEEALEKCSSGLLNKKRYFHVIDNTTYIARNNKIRSSNFRGVSKTGNKWQVLLMHKAKFYLGSYNTEEEAAKVYDSYAIYYFNERAKTNFLYTEEEKANIIERMSKKVNKI